GLDCVRAAVRAVRDARHDAMLLYVGVNGKRVREALGDLPMRDEGPLSAEEVTRRLRAVDIYLAPLPDGISTRRGSLIAGLQHGLPTVASVGRHTDDVLRSADERAFLLAPVGSKDAFAAKALRLANDPALRDRLGRGARSLFE